MTTITFKARAVGLFYLLMTAAGSIPLLVAHPSQSYAVFASGLLVVAAYIPVTVLFYELFEPVSRTVSLTAAFFGLTGCVVQASACLFRIAPLIALTNGQPAASATLLRALYRPAYNISLVFFGFYFVLVGVLVFRSTFIPRLLGVLASIAGLGGLTFLWPPLEPILWPRVILPLWAGEMILVLWLLIAGVNVERWRERAHEAKE
jgi:hypothetical protein